MNIACLGWGSLIWKADGLPLASRWHADGPRLPIEFSRVGDGGELATALCINAPAVPVHWAFLNTGDLELATAALRKREQIPDSREDGVGSLVLAGNMDGALATWAAAKQLDAVIWTALPPRFNGIEGRIPCVDDALAYLRSLTGDTLSHAQDYLCRVPAVFDTPYRRAIREQLDWPC